MRQVIHLLCLWLGVRFTCEGGRRRPVRIRTAPVPRGPAGGPAAPQGPLPRTRSPYGLPLQPLDAGRSPLVRPYVTAHEQQERRTALALALDGVDVGPYIIHGVALGGGYL